MKHNHHLLPKHLGGTNDPSNIVEGVSVTRHAMFHYANWLLLGSEGDRIAYKALAGAIGKEEIVEMVLSFAGKKGGQVAKESGQLREAALKQPRHVRQFIGRQLSCGTIIIVARTKETHVSLCLTVGCGNVTSTYTRKSPNARSGRNSEL